MPTVFANRRSIVHRGDGQTNVCASPNVCLTPTPTGMLPVPYPNLARSADLRGGTATCRIEGEPVAVARSHLAPSDGDAAGSGGGLISRSTGGAMRWLGGSVDVRFEGQPVIGFLDICLHNDGVAPNAGGQPQAGTFDT